MLKNYIGISRDHSVSMSHLASTAMKDYNDLLQSISDSARKEAIETKVSVVTCGDHSSVSVGVREVNVDINNVRPIYSYETSAGGTPLLDSVGKLIEMLENVPDAHDPNVSFLVMVVTDGEENASVKWRSRLLPKIRELQNTNRWTFVFRVPKGFKSKLNQQFEIPLGNIIEWEQTVKGMQESYQYTNKGMTSFYEGRSRGLTASASFYADVTDLNSGVLKRNLDDISSEVKIVNAKVTDEISHIVESQTYRPYVKGTAFYQLLKPEKSVQGYKKILIADRNTNKVYAGEDAKSLLGLPDTVGTIKVNPTYGDYDVFIQSTSTNRKIPAGSKVAVWSKVR